MAIARRGVKTQIVLTEADEIGNGPDANLIEAITLGHKWFAGARAGALDAASDLARRYKVNQADVSRAMRPALLAHEITEAIFNGQQPVRLTAARLKRFGELPLSWRDQRGALGIG